MNFVKEIVADLVIFFAAFTLSTAACTERVVSCGGEKAKVVGSP